jgi:DNA polymerase-1
MNEPLALDTESNTWNTGAPFDGRHKSVCFSWATPGDAGASPFEPGPVEGLRDKIARAGVVIGFNLKYDIHVLRKRGIEIPEGTGIWDCQLAEFILSNQQWKYPSLNESCEKYGLGSKIDLISEKYWKNGIQTEDIPWNELSEYAQVDAELSLSLYLQQVSVMSASQMRLCKLMNADLLVLEEMEWNGIKFNEDLCAQRSSEIKTKISGITAELSKIYPNVPINFGSGDQLSAFLYGGTIVEETKEHVGFFKTGLKAGQPKYQNVQILHELPRLVEPLRGSALNKPGFFATNADTLLKLKANKATRHILSLIQQQVRYETLLSKTYKGLIKKRVEQNWEKNWLHGQFNQVTVATGRLSSSSPNLQNLDSAANDLFVSRYDN